MKLHLVGGFLGSGKTTAIIGAARHMIRAGKRVGIVTNDQGKYLVDTAFFRAADLPAVEVTGGCFCCHYNDLDTVLNQLETDAHPDVIFAESVGSCADLVATVVKPLQTFHRAGIAVHSLSIFADSRLLHRRLNGLPLPFGENVVYIFDKQLEEAGLLIINKTDLLSSTDVQNVRERAQQHYPDKRIITQTSTAEKDLLSWVKLLDGDPLLSDKTLHIDYDRYGAGEAELAWLNEEIAIQTAPGEGRQAAICFLENFLEGIARKGCTIGHFKVWIQAEDCELKLSFPTLAQPDWQNDIPHFPAGKFSLLLNARVQTSTHVLGEVLAQTIEILRWTTRAVCSEQHIELFHPAYPRPQHRMT